MSKPAIFLVDEDNYVHTWACKLDFKKEPQPYMTIPKTATELVEWLGQPDRQNQFGSLNSGPSILKTCGTCIPLMLNIEMSDA